MGCGQSKSAEKITTDAELDAGFAALERTNSDVYRAKWNEFVKKGQAKGINVAHGMANDKELQKQATRILREAARDVQNQKKTKGKVDFIRVAKHAGKDLAVHSGKSAKRNRHHTRQRQNSY